MYRYAVAGAGLQGTAAAYDLGLHGNAEKILLIDAREDKALSNAQLINGLLGKNVVKGIGVDVLSGGSFIKLLESENIQTLISAMNYKLNIFMTWIAIKAKLNICDLGGNTDVVRSQHRRYHDKAKEIGVTISPDDGMGPGLNISLAMYAMSMINRPRELYIWDGGLPQNPEGPWNYNMTFNIEGLTNEYSGNAYFLRNGKIVAIPALSELEILDFPDTLGILEAAVTSGGLSTAPWTLQGKLERLENKTLRYPGHWKKMRILHDLGMFDETTQKIGKISIAPREMLHALLEPQIKKPDVPDICVIRTQGIAENRIGHPPNSTVE